MQHERRAGAGKILQPLGTRHLRGPPGQPGQNDTLGNLGHRQLAAEHGCGRCESGHAGSKGISNSAPLEPADLLGDGAEHGQIA